MNIWVDTDDKLEALCARLSVEPVIALDTEFMRTDTFHPKLALIQLSDGHDCWLIDVLRIDTYTPLRALLEDSQRVVILHACAEDVEVLEHALAISLGNIFDTQIAAGIVNIGYSMGYARLLERLMGVQLDKQQTRSNWMARPLSSEQLRYAGDDVIYLHRMQTMLNEQLDRLDRWSWLDAETQAVIDMVAGRKNVEDYYQRVKGAHRLSADSLRLLRRLCIWREAQARELDRPRGHILKDPVLLELAVSQPKNKAHLSAVEGFYSRDIARYGDSIISEIVAANDDPQLAMLPQPLSRAANTELKAVRTALSEVARAEDIPVEYLASKKELESVLRSIENGAPAWPQRLCESWRARLVKPAIERVLACGENQA
tara:strand:+ start:447 stop:1565 length:1119 start_codon:yes stop_codon:yes gene_type:complete